MPKPVQQPHPELMVGGGGEKATARIAAKHADHWNVWGGPATQARKDRIVEEHCAAVGRDPKTLLRSANMPLLITENRAEVERLRDQVMGVLGRDADWTQDALLAGSVAAVRDTLARLRETGAGMLFIPSFFLPTDPRPQLDRFMAEVAPAFR